MIFIKINKMLLITSISLMIIKNCEMTENPVIEQTLQLLGEGDKNIELRQDYKDVTLILGNTGAGKTAFLQWIAGDNSKLISKETSEGSAEFIIEDGHRIGSTVLSQTIFPELVIDSDTNAAFYDCPGFSDTRSTAHDIASTYFIKKLTDHSKSLKIILVVNYPSVQHGVDRQDFLLLMRHATSLIKKVDKYSDSIAIVVTKVYNTYVKSFINPDENVKQSVAAFFKNVQKTLNEKLQSDLPKEEKEFSENALKLLNILLKKREKHYSRIMLFRRPDEPGPITNIEILQEGKKNARHVIFQELQFTEKREEDFGYTISDSSKNVMNVLIEKINDNVWEQVSQVGEKFSNHYKNIIQEMSTKVKSFFDKGIVKTDEYTARKFKTVIANGENELLRLISDSKIVSGIAGLSTAIDMRITQQGTGDTNVNVDNILTQGRYFEFLQVVSSRVFPTRPWWSLLEKVHSHFRMMVQNFEEDVVESGTKLIDLAEGDIARLADKVQSHFGRLFNEMNARVDSFVETPGTAPPDESVARNFQKTVKLGIDTMSGLVSGVKKVKKLSDFPNAVQKPLNQLGITSHADNLDQIVIYGRYVDFLQILSSKKVNSKTWESFFQGIKNYLVSSEKSFNEKTHKLSLTVYEKNTKHMENIAKTFEQYYKPKMDSTEVGKSLEDLNDGYVTVTSWIDDTCRREKTSQKWNELFQNDHAQIRNSKLASVSPSITTDAISFSNNAQCLLFLKVFSSFKISICDSKWMTPVHTTAKNLKDSYMFMTFLRDLYSKFSVYDVQSNKHRYNVVNINDWGKDGKSQGIHIDTDNFDLFLKTIQKSGYTEVKDLAVSDVHLKFLNMALVKTLATALNPVCSRPGKLVIVGDFIKFSDFVRTDGVIKSFCEFDITRVDVFALKVVFVDRDVKHNGLQLSIISPRWEVIGGRRISLDGADGSGHPKATSGREPGSNGDDGLPGHSGKPAGDFLGIGQKFIDGKQLTITACGGRGGRGQDGGDGHEGRKGQSARNLQGFERYMETQDVLHGKIHEHWRVVGKPGGRGGDGGNGGLGGVGGLEGKIIIYPLGGTSSDLPSRKSKPGPTGQDGEGGKGGRGGQWGDDLIAYYCTTLLGGFIPGRWCGEEIWRNNDEGPSGRDGDHGTSPIRGTQQLKQDPQNVKTTVSDYKTYLNNNLRDYFEGVTLKEFRNKLESYKFD